MTHSKPWFATFWNIAFAVSFLMLTFATPPAQAQARDIYTDKIYLKNGDRVTGNIKELDRGILRLKTLTMGTAYMNWVDIEFVESDQYLRIERTDGSFNYGRLKKSALSKALVVLDHDQEVELPVR